MGLLVLFFCFSWFSWFSRFLGFLGFLGSCFSLGNIVFEVLVRFPFQKYITSWVFSGFSCSRAICGLDWMGMGWVGWDLCVGLLYEHRFAVLISFQVSKCATEYKFSTFYHWAVLTTSSDLLLLFFGQ